MIASLLKLLGLTTALYYALPPPRSEAQECHNYSIPERFSGPPKFPVDIHYLPSDIINDLHGGYYSCHSNQPVCACSMVEANTCRVYIRSDLSDRQKDWTVAHELAHCNGWPADHPR